MADLPVYKLIRSSNNTAANRILWDGRTPLAPAFGFVRQLDTASAWVTVPVATAYVPPSASSLSDAQIAAAKALVPARRAQAAAEMAVDPFPDPGATPHTTSGGVHGALTQCHGWLERNASGDAAAANAMLASVLPAIPTLTGFQGAADPVNQPAPATSELEIDFFHFQIGPLLYCLYHRHYGLLSPANRASAIDCFWQFARDLPFSFEMIALAPHIGWGSENHGIMSELCCYAAAHFADADPTLTLLTYSNGSTPAQQRTAWRTRLVARLNWMGRHGVLSEFCSAIYAKYTLGTLTALASWAPDTDVKAAAKNVLDLFWCAWAQESVAGWHGGSRNRMYPDETVTGDPVPGAAWAYFGHVHADPDALGSHDYAAILFNTYLPPDVAFDLALDPARTATVIETRQPSADLDWNGTSKPIDPNSYLRVDTTVDNAPSLRYAYITPEFGMGSIRGLHVNAKAYVGIASQNRWNGVVFDGPRQRVVVSGVAPTDDDSDCATLAVQSKATAIVAFQAAPYSNNASGNVVRFGDTLALIEEDAAGHAGWVFALGATGWAAVKVPGGTYTWGDTGAITVPVAVRPPNTVTLQPSATTLPVVIQAAGNSDFADFDAFRTAVLTGITATNASGVVTVTGGLFSAGTLVFNTATWATPTIGGAAASAASAYAFQSPFINGMWGGNTVTVTKGARTLSLSFG